MGRIVSILCAFLLAGRTVLAAGPEEIASFHHAVQIGDLAKAEAMLKADPKLATSTDKYGFQPIHLLDMYFDPKLFDLLRAAGADVNARNEDGITLLHIVVEAAPVAKIVKAGGNIEARDNHGRTPLLLNLTEPDREDVIEALIDAGADVNARDDAGKTALSMSRLHSNDDLTRLLIKAGARP